MAEEANNQTPVKTPEQIAIEKLDGIAPAPVVENSDGDVTPPVENVPAPVGDKVPVGDNTPPAGDDFDKVLKERFENKEKFDAHFNEFDELRKKLTALETENEELKKSPEPFDGAEHYIKLNAVGKKLGIKDFGLLERLNPENLEKMSDLEVVKFKRLIDEPDYKGREHILDRRLSDKYSVTKPEDYDDMTPEEKKKFDSEAEDREFDLKKDAKKAREDLSKTWNDAEAVLPKKQTPEDAKKQHEARVRETITKWKSPVERDVTEAVSKVKMEIPLDKGKIPFELEIPETMKQAQEDVLKMMVEHVFVNRLEPTHENVAKVKEMAADIFFIRNKDFMLGKFAETVRKMTDEQWRTMTHNPSALAGVDTKGKEQKKTPEQEAIDKLG
jgi:hypothetical protein